MFYDTFSVFWLQIPHFSQRAPSFVKLLPLLVFSRHVFCHLTGKPHLSQTLSQRAPSFVLLLEERKNVWNNLRWDISSFYFLVSTLLWKEHLKSHFFKNILFLNNNNNPIVEYEADNQSYFILKIFRKTSSNGPTDFLRFFLFSLWAEGLEYDLESRKETEKTKHA